MLSAASLRPSPPQPELLTLEQAAGLLGVSPRTLRELAKDGTLPPVHVRRCTRWRRADVLAYIAALPAEVRSDK
jgi:excisionase family DNA binding protein